MSEAEITHSDSDSFVGIEVLQWVEVNKYRSTMQHKKFEHTLRQLEIIKKLFMYRKRFYVTKCFDKITY
jgi:hypothetical protein